jgi:hypothetical protein
MRSFQVEEATSLGEMLEEDILESGSKTASQKAALNLICA